MATLLPRFSASRMLNEYVERVYRPAARQGARYRANDCDAAKAVAAWKARVRAAWPGVTVRRVDRPAQTLVYGDTMPIEADVALNGLRAEDVVVEILLSRGLGSDEQEERRYVLAAVGTTDEAGEQRFALDLKPELCGRLGYRLRAYPYHPLLTHRFELGLMRWV
jgi:starch phosphorylase